MGRLIVSAASVINDARDICSTMLQLETAEDPDDPELLVPPELFEHYETVLLQQCRDLNKRLDDGIVDFPEVLGALPEFWSFKDSLLELERMARKVADELVSGEQWVQVLAMYGPPIRKAKNNLAAIFEKAVPFRWEPGTDESPVETSGALSQPDQTIATIHNHARQVDLDAVEQLDALINYQQLYGGTTPPADLASIDDRCSYRNARDDHTCQNRRSNAFRRWLSLLAGNEEKSRGKHFRTLYRSLCEKAENKQELIAELLDARNSLLTEIKNPKYNRDGILKLGSQISQQKTSGKTATLRKKQIPTPRKRNS